jgi:hypothetical protein
MAKFSDRGRRGQVREVRLVGADDGTWSTVIDDDQEPLSDEELTALALSADPNAPIDAGAVPLTASSSASLGLLPSWYMPAVALGTAQRYWKIVVIVLVATLFAIEAAGLCSTYGQLVAP